MNTASSLISNGGRRCETVRESRIFFVETSKSRPTHARLRNRELADEAELVSLSVEERVVDRWKNMWRAPRTTMVDPKVSPKISIL